MDHRHSEPETTIGPGRPVPPDQIRDEFERSWNGEAPTRIEARLARVPDTERGPLLASMIAIEIRRRRDKGEAPTVAEYLQRFPGRAELVTRAFAIHIGDAVGLSPGSASTEIQTISYRSSDGAGPGTELEPGTLIGRRYVIHRVLGRGGNAVVYLAHDPMLDQLVALKMPRTDGFRSDKDLANFITEARNAAQLVFPGIVQTYDVQKEFGSVFIRQQFIDGPNLSALMKSGRLSPERAVELMTGVAEALDYAHRNGFIHRDVKPANILLDAKGRPYLSDFGLALHESVQHHHSGELAGTYPYMSPEQVRREVHRLDGRSDLWSLGVILYELLTGSRPFAAPSTEQLFDDIQHRDPRTPHEAEPAVPAELSRVAMKCLAKRAADRYASAAELVDDLRHWRDRGTARVADAAPPPARVVPKGLRSFEAPDSDFFLELLPGPRDREGLPESLRFWKRQVERTDPDERLAVCLMYGPSGSGKSSLVKAGLLPRLAEGVLSIYVEATAHETESRLLRALRPHCPDLPDGATLPHVFEQLRAAGGAGGKKVLVVLDQFEQWLHATDGPGDGQLVRALRQCDGGGLQCLLLVRDDFWMATTRFMQGLEIPLLEGRNCAAVDLFDLGHARKVLRAFGRSFGRLPDGELTAEQEHFLDLSVRGLDVDDKIISVRLALFAEMMKGRPWTAAGLEEVGGPEGVDLSFLHETFSATTAPPAHRQHQEAVRAVLKALLPEHGADIRGRMQPSERLLEVSGYAGRPDDFRDLLAILDGEVRLITPTEPDAPAPGANDPGRPSEAGYYQLTHDFLIPSLRGWLTEKQRETPRGRAELRLEERTSLWTHKPERKQLPSWSEWAAIRLLTDKAGWTAPQRRMMRSASRHHLVRSGLLLAALVAFAGAGLAARQFLAWKSLRDEARLQAQGLWHVGWPSLSQYLDRMAAHPELWRDQVEPIAHRPETPPEERSRGYLALARVDATGLDYLAGRLLEADDDEGAAIRAELRRRKDHVAPGLWREALDAKSSEKSRLAAALALADFEPGDPGWDSIAEPITRALVADSPLLVTPRVEALRPVRGHLKRPLARIFADASEGENPRLMAASILADFAGSDTRYLPADDLTALILDASPSQIPTLMPLVRRGGEEMAVRLTTALEKSVPLTYKAKDELLSHQRANAGEALLRLGRDGGVWPLLEQSPDPRLRTELIDRLAASGLSWDALLDRAAAPGEGSIRQAILLGLKAMGPNLSKADRLRAADRLVAIYEADPDAGVHSGAEWVLTAWGFKDRVAEAQKGLVGPPRRGRGWFVTPSGLTMIIVPAPGKFRVGSPKDEPKRDNSESEEEKDASIDYAFAISAHEVTFGQFRRYRTDTGRDRQVSPDDDCPVSYVTWHEAVRYCRWLNERRDEAIPEDQRPYPPASEVGPSMPLAPDYLRRFGYRLPTEEEWEYVARAGSKTAWFFGNSQAHLEKYAWYTRNSEERTRPVGSLRPNPLGVFDIYGNIHELCDRGASAEEEEEKDVLVPLRGGCYRVTEKFLRSAMRERTAPEGWYVCNGFRVVKVIAIP